MRVRTGVRFDEWGLPRGSTYRDEEPGAALNGTPQYRGRLVIGDAGAKYTSQSERERKAENTRRFRERHGGRRAA